MKGSQADEWTRLASHWELPARIHGRMPMIARRHDPERGQVPNARSGQRLTTPADAKLAPL
jgi:hypothetical protein